MSLAGLFGSWRAGQERQAPARRFVAVLMTEPDVVLVRALTGAGDGDEDHARWELRYARRAIGLLVAQRDALDDLTGSDVAAALEIAHRADPRIAPERRAVADRQFNERLKDYRNALADRSGALGTSARLARVLLTFSRARISDANMAFCAEAVAALVFECNAALREAYGDASLPDDVRPSETAKSGRGKGRGENEK